LSPAFKWACSLETEVEANARARPPTGSPPVPEEREAPGPISIKSSKLADPIRQGQRLPDCCLPGR
jgi:hypothetical protein